MEHPTTPVLIDAFLTENLANVVERFLDGKWARLPHIWDVSFEDIVAEGKRRGMECFVQARARHEGYWLAKTDRGYSVQFSERGVDSDRSEFSEMEPAFRELLHRRLQYYQLSSTRQNG